VKSQKLGVKSQESLLDRRSRTAQTGPIFGRLSGGIDEEAVSCTGQTKMIRLVRDCDVRGALHTFVVLAAAAVLVSCVHQEDLQSWAGRPVDELDKQPLFLTMQSVRTRAADGTEIRNYINGRNVASCSGGGTVFAGNVDMATYSQFSSCMHAFAACNNIFYIKNGTVTQYTPIGTGGAHCYTDERVRPGFAGATNIQ
jgi:hypothetical protein